jgi:hypothetical protein
MAKNDKQPVASMQHKQLSLGEKASDSQWEREPEGKELSLAGINASASFPVFLNIANH